jgi:hypothetical protein
MANVVHEKMKPAYVQRYIMNSAMKGFLLYALLAFTTQWTWAQSTIVYSPGPEFALPWSFGPAATLDLNEDGTIDFSFSLGPSTCTDDVPTSFCSQPAFVSIAGTNSILNQGSYAASVPFGEWVGSSAVSNTAWFVGAYTYLFRSWHSPRDGTSGIYGPIGEQGSGYLGVRFSAVDGDHYGWVYVQGWSVVDWAYETRPNQPIRAGAKPVPVPLSQASVERPGYLRLVAETENGKAYQVQTKDSLLDFSWSNLSFALPSNSTNTMVDIPMTDPKAFFRIVEAD